MKDKIFTILFISFLSSIFLINILVPNKLISKTERRKLTQFPKISFKSVMNKEFMEEMDSYTVDQFVIRDSFRELKAKVNYNIFRKLDNNKMFLYKDYIFKSDYPTKQKSINNFIEKINNVSKYLSEDNNIYYSIIPEKNYYLDSKKYLNIDYDYLYEEVKKINYNYIELRDVLSIEDYYKTDTHWKQENLCKVVNRLGSYFNFYNECDYEKNVYKDFYGVYYGQSAMNTSVDDLIYLTNDNILNSRVYYFDRNKYDKIYIEENLNNLDSYDIFLDGASSFVEIYNDKSLIDKELVIFRDSFASSLAPLLINHYKKITLIDLRYIDRENYLSRVDFSNQDVLFLYSTLIVNNSYTLKK